jgi:hypothetical protein
MYSQPKLHTDAGFMEVTILSYDTPQHTTAQHRTQNCKDFHRSVQFWMMYADESTAENLHHCRLCRSHQAVAKYSMQ